MNRTLLLVAPALVVIAAFSGINAAPVLAAETAAAAKPAFNTEDTDLGTLLDNAATKTVLVKYIPDVIGNPQIDMARSMTLKQLQSYAADKLTDETLTKIDADLAKVPAPK